MAQGGCDASGSHVGYIRGGAYQTGPDVIQHARQEGTDGYGSADPQGAEWHRRADQETLRTLPKIMKHSVIIPHRNRAAYLDGCIWSIYRAARMTGFSSCEILIVDNPPKYGQFLEFGNASRFGPFPVKIITDSVFMQPFNKARLLNLGIERASGDVLTFLDADAIVPERFLTLPLMLLDDEKYTKLCWRVRCLNYPCLRQLEADPDGRDDLVAGWFDKYSKYDIPFEAYGEPHTSNPSLSRPEDGPAFGNSQFSITREKLGDLRYNEEYKGRGFEDLWMNREIWRQYSDDYNPVPPSDSRGMFHIRRHPHDEPERGWDNTDEDGHNEREKWNLENKARYEST